MVTSKQPGWAHSVLGKDGADRIEAAIASAEANTSGEIVPILVRRSSTVGHVFLLSFSLLLIGSLLVDLPAYLVPLGGAYWVWQGGCWLFATGLAAGLQRFDFVQRQLTESEDQMAQVDRRAQIEFYELGVSQTRDRTGILLFVSSMERRAVVLADQSIAEKVDAGVWQELVDTMIAGIKGGDFAEGMAKAIERCGEILSPHFPVPHDDTNELHDHLVIKD